MKQVLLVEPNTELESIYSLNLRTYVGVDVFTKKRAEFALKLEIPFYQSLSLIILRNKIGQEMSAELIQEFLKTEGLDIPLLIIGGTGEEEEKIKFVKNPLDLKSILKSSGNLMNVTAQDMVKLEVPDYFSIPINYFSHLETSAVDVYEENLNLPNDYLLKIQAKERFDSKIIKSYIASGVAELFVKKLDRLKFVNGVTEEALSRLNPKDLEEDDRIIQIETSQNDLRVKLETMGITDEAIEIAQKTIKNLTNTVQRYPRLASLMRRMLTNKSSYLYKHTQLITYVGQHILQHIDWGTSEQKEKFAFIALFHDITLKTDAQAMIKSEKELKQSKLTEDEKELVKKHAQLSAAIVTKYPRAPMGADQIIRQHHGALNGVGFAETFGANISPLSIIFIISEDFTDALIENEGNINIERILEDMRSRYTTQRFIKLINLLEKITL